MCIDCFLHIKMTCKGEKGEALGVGWVTKDRNWTKERKNGGLMECLTKTMKNQMGKERGFDWGYKWGVIGGMMVTCKINRIWLFWFG